METIKCDGCGFANKVDASISNCQNCGASLAAAKLLASLQAANERLAQLAKPAKSFTTFNGFGTTLLDYRQRDDGLHEATRWVVAMMIPLIPLSAYVIRLGTEERSYGRESQRFTIIEKTSLSPARVLWVYFLVAIALLPLYLFGYNDLLGIGKYGWHTFVLRGLIPIVWAGFIIFYWLQRK